MVVYSNGMVFYISALAFHTENAFLTLNNIVFQTAQGFAGYVHHPAILMKKLFLKEKKKSSFASQAAALVVLRTIRLMLSCPLEYCVGLHHYSWHVMRCKTSKWSATLSVYFTGIQRLKEITKKARFINCLYETRSFCL